MIQTTVHAIRNSRSERAYKELAELAERRVLQGFSPPPEIYLVHVRQLIDWSKFPAWAQPSDPELFEGCSHEG